MKFRIVIADDHEMIREGLEVMIGKIDEFEIVGAANNGEQLIQLTRKLKPDVVLTDVKMPVMSGTEATEIIKKELPHIGVIALTSFDEENLITDMLRAGAKGYLLKTASKQELTEAVKAVYNDEAYYCKQTRLKLGQMIAGLRHQAAPKSPKDLFTLRELEVIELICAGLSSKQIADKLTLKTRSVESYRESIMEKMEVNNAAAVVMYAVTYGLCKPNFEKK